MIVSLKYGNRNDRGNDRGYGRERDERRSERGSGYSRREERPDRDRGSRSGY